MYTCTCSVVADYHRWAWWVCSVAAQLRQVVTGGARSRLCGKSYLDDTFQRRSIGSFPRAPPKWQEQCFSRLSHTCRCLKAYPSAMNISWSLGWLSPVNTPAYVETSTFIYFRASVVWMHIPEQGKKSTASVTETELCTPVWGLDVSMRSNKAISSLRLSSLGPPGWDKRSLTEESLSLTAVLASSLSEPNMLSSTCHDGCEKKPIF